jgi:tetratricopeptide (TPR) repeat protein
MWEKYNMPNLSLRAYEKQIENLIEENHIDEAIQHCQQILRSYPKCISTYRILGKALLEGKRYDESADVFERVLIVFPDDYIAHVGMSIIQENNGNLDASIWHMELAFDSQPSNITIQEELKRLLGLRDGTHPAKIRLTRGALVRMYARGELYPQAIAEIKSALAEDNKRVDLKVLLAKMNYLLGDSVEALNLANQLIGELPYCYEINQILVSLLPGSDKAEKTSIYRDRLQALNPYEALVGEKYSSEAEVPDDQVTIEQLNETDMNPSPQNSGWVKNIDSKWEEPDTSKAWSPFADDKASATPFSQSAQEETPSGDQSTPKPVSSQPNSNGEEMPDWMRSAGWLPTNETSGSEAESQNPFANDQPAQEAESANLPDWLRTLAPEEPETALSGSAESESKASQDQSPIDQNTNSEQTENDLPDWLKSFEAENSSAQNTSDQLPDWMNPLQPEGNQPPEETPASPFAEEVAPTAENTLEPEPQKSTNTLPPLFDEEEDQPVSNPAQTNTVNEDTDSNVPDWVRSVMTGAEPATSEPEDALPAPSDQLEQTTDENTPSAISEKTGDDLLSWLRDLKPEEEESTPVSEEPVETTTEESGSLEDFSSLDRLEHLTDERPKTDEPQEEIPAPEPVHNSIVDSFIGKETPTQEATEPEPAEEVAAPAIESNSVVPEFEVAASAPPQPTKVAEPAHESSLDRYLSQTKINPDDFSAWQALGDEYARINEFSKALAAYNKAEELIIHSK